MPARSRVFDPVFGAASEAADALRLKKISARELLQQTFNRLDRQNPGINAVVYQFRERAFDRARAADDALARRQSWGPLHGVPITIKESFAYAGSPSTWGMPELKDDISSRTAPAVERLESAGAIVIGKTNVPAMLLDWQSYNPVYGTTNNPWDLTRTAGGSSGGGSAALASGLGFLTLGSDIGGSIRLPAHFCGVYGHKPSIDLVSIDGHVPGAWHGSVEPRAELPVAGPLARSARDLLLALTVAGGPNSAEAKAWQWRVPLPRRKRLRGYRIGYVLNDEFAPVAADVHRVYDAVLEALAREGVVLTSGWPEGVNPEAQFRTYRYLLDSFLGAIMLTAEERAQQQGRFVDDPSDEYAAAVCAPHYRWYEAMQSRTRFQAAWQSYFETHDAFLMPAAFSAAFPHDHSHRDLHVLGRGDRMVATPEGMQSYNNLLYWITSASLAGLPSTVAPVGRTSTGLPVGIQILGPLWEDGTPIELAALFSDVVGGFVAPPALHTALRASDSGRVAS